MCRAPKWRSATQMFTHSLTWRQCSPYRPAARARRRDAQRGDGTRRGKRKCDADAAQATHHDQNSSTGSHLHEHELKRVAAAAASSGNSALALETDMHRVGRVKPPARPIRLPTRANITSVVHQLLHSCNSGEVPRARHQGRPGHVPEAGRPGRRAGGKAAAFPRESGSPCKQFPAAVSRGRRGILVPEFCHRRCSKAHAARLIAGAPSVWDGRSAYRTRAS